jgi:hypothetical protein
MPNLPPGTQPMCVSLLIDTCLSFVVTWRYSIVLGTMRFLRTVCSGRTLWSTPENDALRSSKRVLIEVVMI